jgi:hypothetical protein
MFNQKASQYSDPNTESYQNSNNCGEDLFSSSSSSSSSPNHSVTPTLNRATESSNLLKESPQRLRQTTPIVSDTGISKEEKVLIDFGNNDIKTKNKGSANSDWNTGWDDEAWNKLEVDVPKAKNTSKRS